MISFMTKLKHELWKDIGGEEYSEYTFCLAGPKGAAARNQLSPGAELIWTVEASSHFEAMTAYYKFMGGAKTQLIKNGI